MTDSQFLLEILSDGEPHSTMEIISRSISERGCGLTPHSRASDLRKDGHNVVVTADGQNNGRTVYVYRLVSLDESSQSDPIAFAPEAKQEERRSADAHAEIGREDSSSELTLFDTKRRPAWA